MLNILGELKDGRMQRIEEMKTPHQRAIKLVFARHQDKPSMWKLKANKALQQEGNAALYIEAGEEERDEILEALMADM